MKRRWIMLVVCLFLLGACGGGTAPPAVVDNEQNQPAEQADESATTLTTDEEADPEATEAEDGAIEESSGDEEPATEEEAGADEPAADSNPAGLPVNPDPVVPGEQFIVEGVIVNASMIPVDAPQFVIEGDNGVRYRLNSQPADEIFTTTGEQLLPYQYGPGVRVRATALLPADATLADVAETEDLVVIQEE